MATESAVADPPVRRPRRPRRRTVVLVVLLAVALVVTAAALPFSLYRQIDQTDISLKSLPDRPSVTDIVSGSLNVAVLGTADGRCVSAMILHIAASRVDASFVSVPASGACGTDPPRLTPEVTRSITVKLEEQSGIRLDHLAVLDWETIAELDRQAGGVMIDLSSLPENADDAYPTVHGDEVLPLVSSPIATAHDESVRIKQQQVLLQEVLRATLHQEMRNNPVELYTFLNTVTGGLALDADWSFASLSRLALSLRNLRSKDITFHTAPAADGNTSTADDPLWVAVREDRMNDR